MSDAFIAWLTRELERRDWSREQLANKAGIHSSVLANIYSGRAAVGPETARKVAAALDVSSVLVFRLAGILPEEDDDAIYDRLRYEFDQIESEEDRERLIALVRAYRKSLSENPVSDGTSTAKGRKPARGSAT